MKTFKYKVTGPFGLLEGGTVIDCVPLVEGDGGVFLVYHPKDKTGCGSFEICKRDKEGFLISVDEDCYCNRITLMGTRKFREAILGIDRKFRALSPNL